MLNKKKERPSSLSERLVLELIDTDERREQIHLLLNELLPTLAADVENKMHDQEARVFYELCSISCELLIRVVLRLKKFEHEFLIQLNPSQSMFAVGGVRSGIPTGNAQDTIRVLSTQLLKLRS